MTLLTDWKVVLRKAWSVRFMVLAGTLSAGEVLPCLVTEARLMGMANYATDNGKRITLEIERG